MLGCFFTDPNWKNRWEGVEIDPTSAEAAPQIVRAYLSRQHFDDVENSCPMVALPNDVARSDERPPGSSQQVLVPDFRANGARGIQTNKNLCSYEYIRIEILSR